MTDRPALARALIDLVVTMTRRRTPPQTSEVATEVARVLAEHETANQITEVEPGLYTLVKREEEVELRHLRIENAEQQAALEAAEARCAQLEQQRDYALTELTETRRFWQAAKAEHDRLRTALTKFGRHQFRCAAGEGYQAWREKDADVCNCGLEAALAPSQESVK